MTKLSAEQEALKASIQKSAIIWGVILGLIAAGIAYWALGGQGPALRMGGAAAIGAAVLGLIASWRMKANSTAAACGKCGATFSITRTDRAEEVKSSEPKETREAQPDYSTKVTTWVEDTIEVTDTYTCAKCSDTTTKKYPRTVKRDEVEAIEPAPEKGKAKEAPAGEDKDAPEGESWFSEEAPEEGGQKPKDDGTTPAAVDGVASSQKSRPSGKSTSKK